MSVDWTYLETTFVFEIYVVESIDLNEGVVLLVMAYGFALDDVDNVYCSCRFV